MNITKKTFCEIIKLIQEQDKINTEVGDALEKVCDSWVIYGTKDSYRKALNILLKELIDDDFGTISWWLYEDVEKKVYSSTTGKVLVHIKTSEDLYDYLIKEKKRVANKKKRTKPKSKSEAKRVKKQKK